MSEAAPEQSESESALCDPYYQADYSAPQAFTYYLCRSSEISTMPSMVPAPLMPTYRSTRCGVALQ